MNIIERNNAISRLRGKPNSYQYRGLSRDRVDAIATALVEAAADTGHWDNLPEHLIELRKNLLGRR